MKLIAITACVTGVAHTYMAAAALTKAAKVLGHSIKVETQGALGIENELTADDIRSADAAIIAADTSIQKRERLQGIPVLEALVGAAIKDPQKIVNDAVACIAKQ